jgi:hypothetical protein
MRFLGVFLCCMNVWKCLFDAVSLEDVDLFHVVTGHIHYLTIIKSTYEGLHFFVLFLSWPVMRVLLNEIKLNENYISKAQHTRLYWD